MCAIAYYLESAGIMTTGIALVRENAEALQPPRLLWVPFPLGRPLGKPGDADFQTNVIASALALLEYPDGPVLEDFPLDVPPPVDEVPACPVAFARETSGTWKDRLDAELAALAPWYDLGRRRRGRTTFGVSGLSIERVAEVLAGFLDESGERADLVVLKRCLEDAKAFYTEALTAQPGDYDTVTVNAWLWEDTELGALQKTMYRRFRDDARGAGFARIVAPRSAIDAPRA